MIALILAAATVEQLPVHAPLVAYATCATHIAGKRAQDIGDRPEEIANYAMTRCTAEWMDVRRAYLGSTPETPLDTLRLAQWERNNREALILQVIEVRTNEGDAPMGWDAKGRLR
jgi:hypothetical protein